MEYKLTIDELTSNIQPPCFYEQCEKILQYQEQGFTPFTVVLLDY